MKKVNLLTLYWKFFKIGAFTFGGGFAMIPLIEKEVVANKWIDANDVADMVAISQSIPGAVAVNMSLFVGFRIAKKIGAIVAVLGCITPSFMIIMAIAMFFDNFKDYAIIQNAFIGILSCVVALILLATIKYAKKALLDWITVLITLITVLILVLTPILPFLLVLAGGLIGVLFYFIYPKKVAKISGKGGSK